MIISHKHKFIFIEPKKTGTTTLRSVLTKKFTDECSALKKHRHENIQYYSINPEILEEYYIFSCCRNPWARLVSFYFWAKDLSPQTRLAKELEFLPWLEKFSVSDQVEPCWEKTCDKDGNQLASKICRMENLQEDFNEVCDSIGIQRIDLPHKLATDHDHYSSYFDERSKEIAGRIYKNDIENFGYKFES